MLSTTNFLESVVGFNVSLSEVGIQSGVCQEYDPKQICRADLDSSPLWHPLLYIAEIQYMYIVECTMKYSTMNYIFIVRTTFSKKVDAMIYT